ncbi:MAG: hypothetical protein U0W40_00580 [Acidimicrobiia bacterium]
MPAPRLAQTNVQLLGEVLAHDWSDDDLRTLRSAYELAIWAFSGQYRANGKTQIAHHVGTASALLQTGARPALVTAGLVHSLYFLGEFGTGRLAVEDQKRARVRAAVGAEIEAMVLAYTDLPWSQASIRELLETPAAASAVLRDAIAMRVANEVDEFADAAMRWCAPHHALDIVGQEGAELVATLATAYDQSALGELLRECCATGLTAPVADLLVSTADNTVFVPPASYRRRLHIALQDSNLGHEVAERIPGARRAAQWVREKLA